MEFRVLGPLEVEGAPSLGGPKQRAVLAQLLLSAGRPVPAARLVDEVWGERPPAGAGRSLEVYASRLRQAIAATGAEIVRRGSGYELVLGGARVDVDEFRAHVDAGRAALAAGDAATARTRLRRAVELWRGPALADLDGGAGAGLDEERLAAEEELAEAELRLGRHAELVPELERRAREDPLRERTRAQLMLALYRSGRQADALAAFRETREALDELGLEPGGALRELEVAILRQDPALDVEPAARRQRPRLPAPATALIGRRDELVELTGLVRGGARLVTLTGPGGIGKTRLALAAATELADDFADGVHFVALAPLEDASLVPQTIAGALEVPESELAAHVAGRELLLVLDNFEHVLGAATAVAELLAASPRLKALATSRGRLDLYGEHELPVPPLSREDAVALFLARARAARHGFAGGEGVDELCERLDRLPLALELVAARARELSLRQLLESAGLDLAGSGSRDLPERQRTLRAAIAWSEARLGGEEQRLFAALGVFAGGFDADAAEAVWPGAAALLPALVDAALVRRGDGGRLRLLATVREYALERLRELGDESEVRRRHLDHYSRLAAGLRLLGEGEVEAHARHVQERDNLRAALAFARETADGEALLGLVRDLSRFWYRAAASAEAAEWADVALAVEDAPTLLRAQALRGAALNDWNRGELELAESRAREARTLIEQVGEESELLSPLSILGAIAHSRGDVAGATALYEESVERARRLGELSFLSIALNNLGAILYGRRDWERAGAVYAESLEAARRLGSQELEAFAVAGVASVAFHRGDLEEARAGYRAAIAVFSELGFLDRVAATNTGLAWVLLAAGNPDGAARLLGAAAGLREQTGGTPQPQELEDVAEVRAQAEAALGAEAFAAAFRAGAADPEGEVARALAAG